MTYKDVEEKTLAFYQAFNERAARRDENLGKADGKRGFPDAKATDYPFVMKFLPMPVVRFVILRVA